MKIKKSGNILMKRYSKYLIKISIITDLESIITDLDSIIRSRIYYENILEDHEKGKNLKIY